MKGKYKLLKKTLVETHPCFLHTFVTHESSLAVQTRLSGFTSQSEWIRAVFIKACVVKIGLGISHPKPTISQSTIVNVSGLNQEL